MKFVFDPGLVFYLPLHGLDGPSFISREAYGHPCTVTGAVWTPQGRYFDGVDDKIVLPDSALWAFGTNPFTMEFWARTRSVTSPRDLFSHGDDSDVNYFMLRKSDGSAGYILVWLQAAGATALKFNTPPVFTANRWLHFALVRLSDADSAGAWAAYADGNAVSLTKSAGNWNASILDYSAGPRLGSRLSGGTDYEFWDGDMGEVRIYRRALTAHEIRRNYLATKWRYQ